MGDRTLTRLAETQRLEWDLDELAAWFAWQDRLDALLEARQDVAKSCVTVADDRLISSYWEGWQEGVARRLAAGQETK